jgi:hydroxyethylthiazole kinase-like uncharacterized protein yjeF
MEFIQQLLHRAPESHKYSFGHVLILGGSPGMIGAPLLSARAALRSGAGLVSVAALPYVADRLDGRVDEIMTLTLSTDLVKSLKTVTSFISNRKVKVVVIGPGMQSDAFTEHMLRGILKDTEIPIIIDGGGLTGGKVVINELKPSLSQRVILTPHLGEFKKITGQTFANEQKSEIQKTAIDFANVHSAVVVLKGSASTVYDANGNKYVNNTGNPGLATAGSGDVLTGVIAAMIAQGGDVFTSAKAGVYLHGLAGDIAAASKTQPGMVASDVIESLPQAFKRCQ